MAGKKKSRNKDKALQTIILITAILNLAATVIKLVTMLTG